MDTQGKWGAGTDAGVTPQTSVVRTGTHAARASGVSYWLMTKSYVTTGGPVVGMAFRFDAAGSWYSNYNLIEIREGSVVHLAVGLDANQKLIVKLGNTTILATGTTQLVVGAWYYIEVKAIIHDTAGSYEVRLDAVTELIASGVDTRNGGTGVWDRVLVCHSFNSAWYVDDFYLCDTTGAPPRNTFLGPVKVETLYPQTDAVAAGSNAGLTPSTGTDHGAMVDENPPTTTDYNASATVGVKDTYNYPSMAMVGTIFGIQTNLYVAKSDTSGRQVCSVLRVGAGPDVDGSPSSLASAFTYLSEVRSQKPDLSEWTTADVAALQVGMKIVA
jgi:hypothetical protein